MKAKEFVFLLLLFSFRERKKEEERGMISVKEIYLSEVSKIILNTTLGRVARASSSYWVWLICVNFSVWMGIFLALAGPWMEAIKMSFPFTKFD